MNYPKNLEHDLTPGHEIDTRLFIQSLCEISGVPAFQRTSEGTISWEQQPRLCTFFDRRGTSLKTCPFVMASAAETCSKIKEPYVFLCPCEMLMFACPAESLEEGVFFIGPLVMGPEKDEAIEKVLAHLPESPAESAEAISLLYHSRIWSVQEITSLYRILLHYFESGSKKQTDIGAQQDFVDFATDNLREKNPPYTSIEYPEDPQGEILKHLIASDSHAAINSFRLFYEKNYIMTSGNLDVVRMQIIELFNYLCTRLNSDSAINYFLENLPLLSAVTSFNGAYTLAEGLISSLAESQFEPGYEKSGPVPQSLRYINQNFEQNITLSEVADHVHLAPSYLSSLFKKETGKNFSRILTDVRLANACHLLRNTNRSITDIATMSGFSSQSYFIRVFRDAHGITPKQYRRQYSV